MKKNLRIFSLLFIALLLLVALSPSSIVHRTIHFVKINSNGFADLWTGAVCFFTFKKNYGLISIFSANERRLISKKKYLNDREWVGGVAGRAGKLEILPIIEKKLFQNRNREMEKGNDNTPGERETESDVKEGKCNFACFIEW